MNLETNYNNVDVCGKQIHVVQKQIKQHLQSVNNVLIVPLNDA